MIASVVEMREVEKASFITIGKKLRITQVKAKRTYEMFYHEQVLKLVKALQDKGESDKEKRAVWEYCFRGYRTAKKRYDMLTKEQDLAQHLPCQGEGGDFLKVWFQKIQPDLVNGKTNIMAQGVCPAAVGHTP